jgi:hypothetical protein
MTDLNSLVKPSSTPLYLVYGNYINSHDEIATYAFNPNNGEFRAALAIPCDEQHSDTEGCVGGDLGAQAAVGEPRKVILPQNGRELLRKRSLLRRFSVTQLPRP